jgi:hypothetical protein
MTRGREAPAIASMENVQEEQRTAALLKYPATPSGVLSASQYQPPEPPHARRPFSFQSIKNPSSWILFPVRVISEASAAHIKEIILNTVKINNLTFLYAKGFLLGRGWAPFLQDCTVFDPHPRDSIALKLKKDFLIFFYGTILAGTGQTKRQ